MRYVEPFGFCFLTTTLPTVLVNGYIAVARRLWTALPRVLISSRVIYICFDPLRSTQLSKDTQQTHVEQAVTT